MKWFANGRGAPVNEAGDDAELNPIMSTLIMWSMGLPVSVAGEGQFIDAVWMRPSFLITPLRRLVSG